MRVADKEDVDFLVECNNDVSWWMSLVQHVDEQISKSELKYFDNPSNLTILTESKWFIVQKKDGTKIGLMNHRLVLPSRCIELSLGLTPKEQGKGYGTEATQLMVDYLFLSKEIARIQAVINVRNIASQRVVEKAGFQREGTIRKAFLIGEEMDDWYLYSILRDEWKEPKILTKTT